MKLYKVEDRLFVVGLALGVFFGVALNIAPYVATYQLYHGDLYEVIGFPFIFRKLGGLSGSNDFDVWPLLGNVVFVVALALGLAFGLRRCCDTSRS